MAIKTILPTFQRLFWGKDGSRVNVRYTDHVQDRLEETMLQYFPEQEEVRVFHDYHAKDQSPAAKTPFPGLEDLLPSRQNYALRVYMDAGVPVVEDNERNVLSVAEELSHIVETLSGSCGWIEDFAKEMDAEGREHDYKPQGLLAGYESLMKLLKSALRISAAIEDNIVYARV